MNKTTKPSKNAANPATSSREMAERVLGKALSHVESYLQTLGTGQIPTITQKDAEIAGALGQRAAGIVAELRKSELAAAKQNSDITRPRVVTWCRQLKAEERRAIVREIAAIDEQGSVLS